MRLLLLILLVAGCGSDAKKWEGCADVLQKMNRPQIAEKARGCASGDAKMCAAAKTEIATLGQFTPRACAGL
jgi:hypothetical protein